MIIYVQWMVRLVCLSPFASQANHFYSLFIIFHPLSSAGWFLSRDLYYGDAGVKFLPTKLGYFGNYTFQLHFIKIREALTSGRILVKN